MPEPVNLKLKTATGNPLRHKYLRQEAGTRGLFFQLPGDNYGADGPLLYFPSRLLFDAGWDTFSLSYGYQSAGELFSPAHIPSIVDECAAAIAVVLEQARYTRVALAGKSLGAAVLAVLLTMNLDLEDSRAIYLTPPLGTPVFDPVFTETPNPAYIAVGGADRFFDQRTFADLMHKKNFEYALIPGADHSLYIEGDLEGTLAAHARVSGEIVAFVEG